MKPSAVLLAPGSYSGAIEEEVGTGDGLGWLGWIWLAAIAWWLLKKK